MLKKQHLVVIVFLIAMIFTSYSAKAQEYTGAVGGRFGYGIGITGVYFFDSQNGHAIEFLLRYGYHGLILNRPGIHIQGLYEKHWMLGRSNFSAYVGAGPGIGFGKKNSISKQLYFALGISPIIGFDYTSQRLRIPLILALDYKPTFHADFPVSNKREKVGTDFSYYEIAFSVRIGIGRGRRR
jgi:hypothetical protein